MNFEKARNVQIEGSHGRPILLDISFRETGRKKPVVIFAHGFKGFKDWGPFPLVAEEMARHDLVFVRFNFSHNGGTPEQPVDFPDLEAFGENNHTIELDDLGKVLDAVQHELPLPDEEADKEALYLLGHSRGGGACILKAGEDPRVRKLVTWSAVSDLQKRIPTNDIKEWKEKGVIHIPNARTGQDMPIKYQYYEDLVNNAERLNIEKAAKTIAIPWLIVHGAEDETVDRAEAEALQRWNEKAELLLVPETGHTFGGGHPHPGDMLPHPMDDVVERTVRFLRDEKA